MTGLALSDRDMFLVRDIVASCSNVSGDVELLPWQLGEELFSLIECDSLVAWPCEPALRNEDASQGWPADAMPRSRPLPKPSGPTSGTRTAPTPTAPVTSSRSP